jgi:hypothetical protein
MKHIVPLLLIILPVYGLAQNIRTSTIRWSSERTFNATTGQWTDEPTSLITNTGSSFQWKKYDGTIIKNFQIIETVGEWSNTNADGKIHYEVKDGHTNGTISIQRKSQKVKVLIVLATEPPTLFELAIENVQQL